MADSAVERIAELMEHHRHRLTLLGCLLRADVQLSLPPLHVVSHFRNGKWAERCEAHVADKACPVDEAINVEDRLGLLLEKMQGEIEIINVEKKIRNRVKTQMEKSQKEYYLNEQMNAIQK